jgi:xanthine dehydrogenase accessory factor
MNEHRCAIPAPPREAGEADPTPASAAEAEAAASRREADTELQHVAIAAQRWLAAGRPAALGRVVELRGFSTWPGGTLVVADGEGGVAGDVLGRFGEPAVTAGAQAMLRAGAPTLGRAVIDIHGAAVAEAGLSCGGQAEVLLQPASQVPAQLWSELARRAPVALVTRIDGPSAGPESMVVTPDGRSWGDLGAQAHAEAVALLEGGHTSSARLEGADATLLVSAWVPTPRLVVIGGGDLVGCLDAQASMLGWATRATGRVDALDELLDWAGGSAAVVVLTHDPDVDAAALRLALQRQARYVGAMGSRRTQSRRIERLRALGVDDDALERIHRPIGLDLGGRSAPEVALAICAEILADHCGRDGRPLRERTGSIRGR